jgi:hypothetical protein
MSEYKITAKLGDICSFRGGTDVKKGDTVYTKREWVGLTDDEMQECNMDGDFMIDRETAKLNVQAKLKEKNI